MKTVQVIHSVVEDYWKKRQRQQLQWSGGRWRAWDRLIQSIVVIMKTARASLFNSDLIYTNISGQSSPKQILKKYIDGMLKD